MNLEKRKINVESREIQVSSNHFLSLNQKIDLGPLTSLGPRSRSNFPKRYLHIGIPNPFQTSFLVFSDTKKSYTIPQTFKTKRQKYLSNSHDVRGLEWTFRNDVLQPMCFQLRVVGQDCEKEGKVSTRFRACLQIDYKIAGLKANAYFY